MTHAPGAHRGAGLRQAGRREGHGGREPGRREALAEATRGACWRTSSPGSDGLRLLHAENEDAERDSAPAENLLVELLSLPGEEGLATLVLIDEVLMYAREKVGLDPAWRGRLLNFFQYLTQAATKVDRCAIVASLLATDPHKSDTLGTRTDAGTLRHLPPRARGGRPARAQRGRGRGAAPPLLHPRLDPRPRAPSARSCGRA